MNVEFCEDNSGGSKKMRYFRKNKEGGRAHGPLPWIRHCNVLFLFHSCRDCQAKINPFERVTLEGKCTNCKSNQYLTETTWKLLNSNGHEDELSGNASVTNPNLGWNNINLVIKENTLKKDTTYIAQLTGRRGNSKSTVQFTFQTTSPPENGTCKVT